MRLEDMQAIYDRCLDQHSFEFPGLYQAVQLPNHPTDRHSRTQIYHEDYLRFHQGTDYKGTQLSERQAQVSSASRAMALALMSVYVDIQEELNFKTEFSANFKEAGAFFEQWLRIKKWVETFLDEEAFEQAYQDRAELKKQSPSFEVKDVNGVFGCEEINKDTIEEWRALNVHRVGNFSASASSASVSPLSSAGPALKGQMTLKIAKDIYSHCADMISMALPSFEDAAQLPNHPSNSIVSKTQIYDRNDFLKWVLSKGTDYINIKLSYSQRETLCASRGMALALVNVYDEIRAQVIAKTMTIQGNKDNELSNDEWKEISDWVESLTEEQRRQARLDRKELDKENPQFLALTRGAAVPPGHESLNQNTIDQLNILIKGLKPRVTDRAVSSSSSRPSMPSLSSFSSSRPSMPSLSSSSSAFAYSSLQNRDNSAYESQIDGILSQFNDLLSYSSSSAHSSSQSRNNHAHASRIDQPSGRARGFAPASSSFTHSSSQSRNNHAHASQIDQPSGRDRGFGAARSNESKEDNERRFNIGPSSVPAPASQPQSAVPVVPPAQAAVAKPEDSGTRLARRNRKFK